MDRPQNRCSTSKKLVPSNFLLRPDQIVESERIVVRKQGFAGHPVVEAGHKDVQDDIVVFGSIGADRSE